MNIEKVNEELFSQAKRLRMCDTVHKYWYGKNLPVEELFSLYYANLDFCTEYRWPSRKTLKTLFTEEQRRNNGMLVDDTWSLLNPTHAIILGKSRAKARYNAFSVARLTVMDASECEITAKGHAVVHVHVYDKAKVNIVAEDGARVSVFKHSDSCICTSTGQTTIKECSD